MTHLRVGDAAPLFDTHGSDGTPCSSSQFLGHKLLLYFYPRDNTPGCTSQACSLRDQWGAFTALGLKILGVSPDSDTTHQRFAAKHALPFPLIADPEHVLAQAYGVWGEKVRSGKTTLGIIRTSFLIDENGIIEYIFDKVQTAGHGLQVLTYFRRKHEFVN